MSLIGLNNLTEDAKLLHTSTQAIFWDNCIKKKLSWAIGCLSWLQALQHWLTLPCWLSVYAAYGCDAVMAPDPPHKPRYQISLPEWRMPKPPQTSDLVAAACYVARGADLSLHIHFQHPISSTNGGTRPQPPPPLGRRHGDSQSDLECCCSALLTVSLLFRKSWKYQLRQYQVPHTHPLSRHPPSPTRITHAIGTQEDTNLTRFHFLKLQENTLNWWALPTWEGPLLCALTHHPPTLHSSPHLPLACLPSVSRNKLRAHLFPAGQQALNRQSFDKPGPLWASEGPFSRVRDHRGKCVNDTWWHVKRSFDRSR